jgi:cytochrome oxidase assembly protein ShyY1
VRRLRFLLRPGWLALVLGVLIFAGACFWVLSPWQFGRNDQRQSQISTLSQALTQAPEPLAKFLPGDGQPAADQEWFQVTASGHFLPSADTVVRLQEIDSCSDCDPSPAYEVLSAFRTDQGQTLLIDRGYVAPVNYQVPRYAAVPTGHVTITARVHPDQPINDRRAFTLNGHREVYEINSEVMGKLTGLPLRPGYFGLVDNQPGGLGIEALPQLDSGPFLSYAWQWITFGVMAIGGLGYFTWRELKPGGALTPEGRAKRRAERAARDAEERRTGKPVRKVRGRHAIAAMIAEDEAQERRDADAATSAEPAASAETADGQDRVTSS